MPIDDFQRAWNGDQTTTGIDPNTGLPVAPVPVIGAHDKDQATYVDEWAKDPTAAPPVATWVDAGARDANNADPSAQYQAAWHETPAAATPLQDAAAAAAPAVAAAPAPVAAPADDTYNVSYQGQTDSDPGQATVYDKSGKTIGTYSDDLRQKLSNGSSVSASQLQQWGFTSPTAAPAPAAATPTASPSPAPAPAQPAAAPLSPANAPIPQTLSA
jgi:hypothetical protein